MNTPLRDDRDLNAAVRSWLHEGDEPTPDRNRHIGRIMGRVDETKQRRRLWPLNPFGRRAVHSAAGTEGVQRVHGDRTTVLEPALVMTALALTLIVATGLIWVASQPRAVSVLPGAAAVDAADQALYERLLTLWAGEDTDLEMTRQVYAEDAVHSVLWLDDEEVIRGELGLWSRMRESARIDWTRSWPIRLPDSQSGDHRYLLVPTAGTSDGLGGTACVLWIKNEQVTRHDCVMPMSTDNEALPALWAPDEAAATERDALMTSLTSAQHTADRATAELSLSPDVRHHVLSANQVYTLEGIDEWWAVMGGPGLTTYVDADLPAPEGERRWASFNSVGGGTLCVFWARDGLITRHDCIVPFPTTVSDMLTTIEEPPGASTAS